MQDTKLLTREQLTRKLQEHADKNKIKLNPDRKILNGVISGLMKNQESFGEVYCPCRPIRSAETICPCAFHKKEIKETGHCLCRLFVKK